MTTIAATGFGVSGAGRTRPENEDSILIDDQLGLYVVADGMGGHAAGAVASSTAVDVVRSHVENFLPKLLEDDSPACLAKLIEGAIQRACAVVNQMAGANPGQGGMGTTVTLLFVYRDKAVMGHVGDSRLYLHRQKTAHLLSQDHTLVQELYEEGALTLEQTKTSSYAHVLTRSVGHHPSVEVDTLVFDLLPQDVVMICSDGFSDKLNVEQELAAALAGEEHEQLPQRLYDLANETDGSDNISIIMVCSEEAPERRAAALERSAEVLLTLEVLQEMYLFEDLTLEELLRVMKIVCVVDCPAGTVLMREGDSTGNMYIILDGHVVVERAGQEITQLKARTHFGEMALLQQGPRTATVKVMEHSRFVMIDQQGFVNLVNEESSVGVKLLWKLAHELTSRLEQANARLYG